MKFARRLLCLCCFFLFSFGVCFCQVDTAAVGRMVDSLSGAAVKYYEAGKFGEAIKTLDSAFLLAEKHLPLEDRRYTRLLTRKGRCYYLWGNYKKSEFYFQWFVKKSGYRSEIKKGKALVSLATQTYRFALFYFRSVPRFLYEPLLQEEALKIREKTLGKEHPEYATSLINLAKIHLAEGNFDTASQCLRQASSVIQNFLQKSIAQDTERELMNYMAQPLFAQFDDLVFSFLRAHPIDALVFSANNNALANANAIRDALFYRQ